MLARRIAGPIQSLRIVRGIQRLQELGESRNPENQMDLPLFALPHAAILINADDGKFEASRPIVDAYVELFQTLFATRESDARRVLRGLADLV